MGREWVQWGVAVYLVGSISWVGDRAFAQSTEEQRTQPTLDLLKPPPAIEEDLQPDTSDSPSTDPQLESEPSSEPQSPPETQTPPTKQPQKAEDKKKQPLPNQFPPNPLEITEPDPLIPYDYKQRPLTAKERKVLLDAANRLTLVGATKLQQGDIIGAFDAWNRELRFRRLLGPLAAEVVALGRVGDIAWSQTQQTQLRYITKRLDEILALTQTTEKQTDPKISAELSDPRRKILLLEALGFAYQQIRLPKVAATIYEQLLADARQKNDSTRIEAALITLAQLHVSWFNYADAAKAYAELLERVQARNDTFNEQIYLEQLVFIYEQDKQPEQAIAYEQKLIDFHRRMNDPKPIPALIVKIADNYRRLNQLDKAEATYQQAFQLAQPELQFAVAGDALKKLGDMYRENDRLESASRMYAFLVGVEQQAYNTYGVMDAYDQLGQVYVLRKEFPAAIAAFQRGLAIAQQLKVREDYFTQQIQKTAEAGGKEAVEE